MAMALKEAAIYVPRCTRPFVIMISESQDGGYWGRVIDPPGCHAYAQGDSRRAVLAELQRAIPFWYEMKRQAGEKAREEAQAEKPVELEVLDISVAVG